MESRVFWSDTAAVWHRSLLKKRTVNTLISVLVWSLAWILFLAIFYAGNANVTVLLNLEIELDFYAVIDIGLRAGVIFGVLFAFLDIFFEYPFFRRMSYGLLISLKTGIYLLLFFLAYVLTTARSHYLEFGEVSWGYWEERTTDFELFTLVIYFFLTCMSINIFKQLDLMLGPGNILKILSGRFHHPKKKELIFAFIDMRGSTTIAEQLGAIKYSELIQDCFHDLVVVEQNRAEVYQYVGDEVILVWSIPKGVNHANCLWAYFNFQKQLQLRASHYEQKYGLVPFFKAGASVGKVVVSEVGELKREITYLGDALNTASRVQGLCNQYDCQYIITHKLKELIGNTHGLELSLIGDVLLTGKEKPEPIYSVRAAND